MTKKRIKERIKEKITVMELLGSTNREDNLLGLELKKNLDMRMMSWEWNECCKKSGIKLLEYPTFTIPQYAQYYEYEVKRLMK